MPRPVVCLDGDEDPGRILSQGRPCIGSRQREQVERTSRSRELMLRQFTTSQLSLTYVAPSMFEV
jgi:hypothetical protein